MFPFDPPENIRKPLVQGDQKGTLGRKGLIVETIDAERCQLFSVKSSILNV